jgi:hypothetical protein
MPHSSRIDEGKHRHRLAVKGGLPFRVIMMVWAKQSHMSMRCWSTDGKNENPYQYFAKRPIKDYGGIERFLKSEGYSEIGPQFGFPSDEWAGLYNLRVMLAVKDTTSRTEGGYVNTSVYLQPWMNEALSKEARKEHPWEYKLVTGPCLSKQGVKQAKFDKFNETFPSIKRLIHDKDIVTTDDLIIENW